MQKKCSNCNEIMPTNRSSRLCSHCTSKEELKEMKVERRKRRVGPTFGFFTKVQKPEAEP